MYFKIFYYLVNFKGLFNCFSSPPFWLNANKASLLEGCLGGGRFTKGTYSQGGCEVGVQEDQNIHSCLRVD